MTRSIRITGFLVTGILWFAGYVSGTDVGGALDGYVTWDTTGSPYVVTSNVTVGDGDTLKIMPGVDVKFDGYYYIYMDGGHLLAQGTASDSIYFTSNAGAPAAGDWYGLYFGANSSGTVEYSRIDYAAYGVYSRYADDRPITVKKCRIDQPGTNGFYFRDIASGASFVVDSNLIFKSGGYGIYVGTTCRDISISNNIIDSCASYGIELYNNSINPTDSTVVISDNVIRSNGSGFNCGIRCNVYSLPTITGNYISDFRDGINIYSNTNPALNYTYHISGNTIVNGTYGLMIASSGESYANPVLRNNNIYGQSGYAIFADNFVDIDARNNYWGAAATTEMEAGGNPRDISVFYDYYNDPGFARVNYGAWLDTVDGTPVCSTVTGEMLLGDGAWQAKDGYQTGDTLFIQVSDADGNQDGGQIETVYVNIESGTETTPEAVALVETSVDAGVFRAMVMLDSAGTPAVDGVLQLVATDRIVAAYSDQATEYNEADTITEQAFFGYTVIAGYSVEGYETWTLANSPYLVTGDVVIGWRDTLKIDPGVKVFFKALSDDAASGISPIRSEIYVNAGYLDIRGTAADSIWLLSDAVVPARNDWQGIYFSSDCDGFISHCNIENADYGFYFDDPYEVGISVNNSRIENVTDGIYGLNCDTLSPIVVDSCRIVGSANRGIYMYGCERVTITNNRIESADSFALYLETGTTVNPGTVNVVKNNVLSGQGIGYGIYCKYMRPKIVANTIDGFATGLYNYHTSSTADSTMWINFNTIRNCTDGIYFSTYVKGVVQFNNFDAASSADLRAWCFRTTDARYNWWGQNTTDEMEAGGNPKNIAAIYDSFDFVFLKPVDYSGWLEKEVNDNIVVYSSRSDTATEDSVYQYIALAAHFESTPVITFSGVPHWAAVTGETLSGIPDDPLADTFFTVIAAVAGAADTIQVSLAITAYNDPPVISTADPDTLLRANEVYNQVIAGTDPENDTIRYSLVTTPAGMVIDELTGVISWSPDTGDVGVHQVDVEARDNNGGYDTLTFDITVLPAIAATESVTATGLYGFDGIGVTADFLSLTGTGNVAVTVRADSFPPNLPGGNPVKRFFEVTAESTITAMQVVLSFSYGQTEFDVSDIIGEPTLYAARWNGSAWEQFASVVDTANNTVTCTTTQFSLWSLGGEGGPVPVELASFTAAAAAGGVELAWSTVSEQDNLGFNVLRRDAADGGYVQVNGGLIASAGAAGGNYTYADAAGAGTWYYVLEQVDVNGGVSLSDPVVVTVEPTGLEDMVSGTLVNPAWIEGPLLNLSGLPVTADVTQPGVYLMKVDGDYLKVIITR